MDSSKSESPLLTPAQIERQRQLVRFNRLTIYLPITLLAILSIFVAGLMFWLTLFSGNESTQQWREFSSATADIIIILIVLPLLLFVALLPILAVGWFWYTWEAPRPVESWVQKWLWKTDNFVDTSSKKIGSASSTVADYSIKYRASTSRIGRMLDKMTPSTFSVRNETRDESKNIETKI